MAGAASAVGLRRTARARNRLLFILSELDNLDKHRFPPVVAGVATGHNFDIEIFQRSYFVGPRLARWNRTYQLSSTSPTPAPRCV